MNKRIARTLEKGVTLTSHLGNCIPKGINRTFICQETITETKFYKFIEEGLNSSNQESTDG